MSVVLGVPTCRHLWLALENAYSIRSKSLELRLKDELQFIQRGSRSIAEYSRHFKSLCDQFQAIGCKLEELDLSHWFLHGLGRSFTIFCGTHFSLPTLPTVAEIIPKAENFEIFQTNTERALQNQAAFYAQSAVSRHQPQAHGQVPNRGNHNNSQGWKFKSWW